MSTKATVLEVSGQRIDVIRKDIKNLHLAVYPPNGRVRVAAPWRVDDETIRLAVVTRLPWILRRQRSFREQIRQSAREYVNSESHFVNGRRYRLRVLEGSRNGVAIRPGGVLELSVRPGASPVQKDAVLTEWYREQLKRELPALVAKWEPVVGVEVADLGIKRMRTRWGTCNATAGRVWLNLELAKKSTKCTEFVLVHEVVHLIERRHGPRFTELMNEFMPNWRLVRDELNRAPLAHEDWQY